MKQLNIDHTTSTVHLKPNESLSIAQTIGKASKASALTLNLILEKGANLNHVLIQEANTLPESTLNVEIKQYGHSQYSQTFLGTAEKRLHCFQTIELLAPNAKVNLLGLNVGANTANTHLSYLIKHLAPETQSHTLVRGLFQDNANGFTQGKIFVAKNSAKVEANYQNKNLLLSHQAKASTEPQLEIYADDVQCSHGATVGQLDEEALFYCQSRGISLSDAKQLLLQAFMEPILGAIEDKEILNNLQILLKNITEKTACLA